MNPGRPRQPAGTGRQWVLLAVTLVCAMLFVALALEAHEQEYWAVDHSVRSFVATAREPTLDVVMRVLSTIGSGYLLIPLGLAALPALVRESRRLALAVPILAIGGGAIEATTKWLVHRPRPRGTAYGFPSGHTIASVLFFSFLIYLAWRLRLPVWARWAITCVGLVVCVGVGASRVYLNAHWLSDVLGGFLAGGAYAVAVVAWVERGAASGRLATDSGRRS